MKRLLTLVAFFATLHASAQQVNPVPDYVFANRMSAGRNTVTDTAAYFSIGPRYGATRGMMPPMVVDTASFSANKRNGLLIFSVQKNKFLYWDSVGVKWAEMAGTGGSAITGSGVVGYLPRFSTTTNLDTTKLFYSGGRLFLGNFNAASTSQFNVYRGTSYFDSSVVVGGTVTTAGTYGFRTQVTAGSGASTIDLNNSVISTQAASFTVGRAIMYSAGQGTIGASSSINQQMAFLAGNTISGASYNYGFYGQIPTGSQNWNLFMLGEAKNYFESDLLIGDSSIKTSDAGTKKLYVEGSAGGIGAEIVLHNTTANDAAKNSISFGGVRSSAGIAGQMTVTRRGIMTFHTQDLPSASMPAERMRLSADGELLIATTTDAGDYKLQVAGNIYNTGSITTGAPSGGSIKPWKIGEAATVSPTSPNRTLRVEVDGVVYYIHAKTTND